MAEGEGRRPRLLGGINPPNEYSEEGEKKRKIARESKYSTEIREDTCQPATRACPGESGRKLLRNFNKGSPGSTRGGSRGL